MSQNTNERQPSQPRGTSKEPVVTNLGQSTMIQPKVPQNLSPSRVAALSLSQPLSLSQQTFNPRPPSKQI